MTVILVLLFFGIFLAVDHFFKRSPVASETADEPARRQSLPRPAPVIVAGFQVPANLCYHPGHTWALSESPNLVRVGLDDFAAKLVGKIEGILLPQRGQWLRQGQKVWTLSHDGKSVDMVSPIEGTVTDINEAAVRDPELARKDPYGEGWLMTVHSPDARTNFRNLLSGPLARLWIQNSAQRLRNLTPAMAGALAQDGGVAVDHLIGELTHEDWQKLTGEFFLS